MDYAVWKQVGRIMRRQESRFPASKRETRADYIKRLLRAAKRLPPSFIEKAIGDMRRRCQRLFEAKGGHFEEGGQGRAQ